MQVKDFLQVLGKLPEDMEVVCGMLDDDDQFVTAAPHEPEVVPVAGVGMKRAVVIGWDFGYRIGAPKRQRLAAPAHNGNRVIPSGTRAGKCGIPKGSKVRRIPQVG